MTFEFPYRVAVRFPGELEYIPLIRKYISEILLTLNFGSRFAFRSELIIDEICNNAVCYGSVLNNAIIEFVCDMFSDRAEFKVNDSGGSVEDQERLRKAIGSKDGWKQMGMDRGHGLELVRMLSEQVQCIIDDRNLTSVHVVRKREDI